MNPALGWLSWNSSQIQTCFWYRLESGGNHDNQGKGEAVFHSIPPSLFSLQPNILCLSSLIHPPHPASNSTQLNSIFSTKSCDDDDNFEKVSGGHYTCLVIRPEVNFHPGLKKDLHLLLPLIVYNYDSTSRSIFDFIRLYLSSESWINRLYFDVRVFGVLSRIRSCISWETGKKFPVTAWVETKDY